jgi:transcriptional regulator with XRE-family HTH domain
MGYGARIRHLREGRGLKAKFVAERLGLTPAQYCDLEKGRKRLTAELAAGLADLFGITTDVILRPEVSGTLNDEQAVALDPTG